MKERGGIFMFIGPMFSGKTTSMMRKIEREAFAGFPGLIVRHGLDSRTEAMQTHDSFGILEERDQRAGIRTVVVKSLAEVKFEGERVVGVDEGQFFDDLVLCDRWADEGKTIYVSALDGDDTREIFQSVSQLIPKADRVKKLRAVCKFCGVDAPFSTCLVPKTEQVLVGGGEIYAAVCRRCFKTKKNNK